MKGRKFWPLFVTQALGAVNDNLFKNALVVLALYRLPEHGGAALVALSGGLFLLPYAVFSAPAGQMADAGEKARQIVRWKFWELGLMAVGAVGFWLESFPLLVAVLVGLGVQATFFSPLKYGILPDFLEGDELVAGNGLIEAGTFIGIIIGTVLGGGLVLAPHGLMLVAVVALAISGAGILAARFIPETKIAAPGLAVSWRLWREARGLLLQARANRPVWFACRNISWFWALGALVLAAFPTLARNVLRADSAVVTLMLGVFAVGVGIGALAAGRLGRDANLLRPVVPAGAGISLFTADFALTALHAPRAADIGALLGGVSGWHMLGDLFALSVCGGVFSVPFYVLLQERAAVGGRARAVAANNILNALATLAAGGLAALAYALGVGVPVVLFAAALANAVVAWLIFRR